FDRATDHLHGFCNGLGDAVDQLVDAARELLEIASLAVHGDPPVNRASQNGLYDLPRFPHSELQCASRLDSLCDVSPDSNEACHSARSSAERYLRGLQMHEPA